MNPSNPEGVEVVDLSSDSEWEYTSVSESDEDEDDGLEDRSDAEDDFQSSSPLPVPRDTEDRDHLPRSVDPEDYLILKKRFSLKEFSIIVDRLPPDLTTVLPPLKGRKERRKIKKSERRKFIHGCSFPNCNIKFDYEEVRDAHYKRRHEGIKKPYKCPKCERCFSSRSNFLIHQNTHDGNCTLQCPDCPDKFSSPWFLKKHRDRVHDAGGQAIMCEHCGKSLSGKTTYRSHMSLHFPHLAIPCDICGKKFGARKDLNRHKKRVHGSPDPSDPERKPEPPAICSFCGKSFSSKSYLRTHEKMHTGELELNCEVCGYQTSALSVLRVHMLSHSENATLTCDLCSYAAKTQARLNDHRRTVHREERNFLCTYCGMAFKNKNNWIGHEAIHKNEEDAIRCNLCGRGFKIRRYLISHFRHAHKFYGKIPEDVSQITPESFDAGSQDSTEDNDNPTERRNKVVGDIRNFVCTFCGKTFKYKNNWASHELLHTSGQESVTCTLCGRGFKVRRYLVYHLRRAHKIKGKIPKTAVELAELASSIEPEGTTGLDMEEIPVDCHLLNL